MFLGKLPPPPALILTLILNQTVTLTGGAIFLRANFPDTDVLCCKSHF